MAGVEEFPGRHWHGSGVEETAAEADEGDEQEDLERVGDVVGDLRRDDVEPEDEGQRKADDGRGAEDGVDADESADGQAPG